MVFDKERITPAYKVSFRLNQETEDFEEKVRDEDRFHIGKNDSFFDQDKKQDVTNIKKFSSVQDICKIKGHQHKSLDFFCVDCDQGLCTACLIQDAMKHSGHQIVDCMEEYQKTLSDVYDKESSVQQTKRQKKRLLKD